jgi:hypothetical protein
MVLVTGNWRLWLAGTAVSLIIFLVVLFAVILPSQNTANQAIKSGLKQTQQALNQASQQLNSASGSGSGQVSSTAKTAKHELSQAAKLAACVSAAGTDITKLQACHTKF